jgi:NADH:ubiquinone oxidoreductase subunit F (NADH-binding)
VDYESLRQLGSMMGSGGMVVMGESTAMPAVARHFMRFSVNESCGKCVPCRAGTVQLLQLLDRFADHHASLADLERLEQLQEGGASRARLLKTAMDTAAWWHEVNGPEGRLRSGLTPEREAEVLAAWRARQ